MKLVIFGGVGFIGTNIALLALSRGHRVIAFDNLERPGVVDNLRILKKHAHFRFLNGDIRKKADVAALPKVIDCMINLAANTSVPRSIADPLYDFSINVVGHLNILEFAKEHGKIPVILASSNKVYTDKINTFPTRKLATRYEYRNPTLAKGLNETTDVDGYEGFTNSPYGTAKLTAEKYSREYWKHFGIPIVINRMSCIYGLYQKGVEEQGWIDWFLRAKKYHKPIVIYGDGKQVRDALFGSDVAQVYLYEAEHMDKLSGKTFNVGGGPGKGFQTSLLEIITLMDTEFPGPKLRFGFAPWRPSDQRIYISDIRLLTSLTRWVPQTKLLDGLKAMWDVYR